MTIVLAVAAGMAVLTVVALLFLAGARELRRVDEEGAILRTRPPADRHHQRNVAS